MGKKKSQENTIERIDADFRIGLNQTQVKRQKELGLTNRKKNETSKSYAKIILGNFFTFFNILTFGIAAVIIVIGEYSNALFITIILANLLIGIVQEIKAKLTIEKLSLLNNPVATVVREGEDCQISTDEIVLDDIIRYTSGDQITCDAVLLDGKLEANESLLTGESDAIKKQPGDFVYAGSFVSSGSAVCRVEHVGAENYVEKLSAQAKKFKVTPSELVKSLNLLITVIGFIILPLGAWSFYNNYQATSGNINAAIVSTAGTMIGMIPAGMFLLTSVALAAGILKLSRHKTLVRDLYCIEMLARTNVLCLDKTGTITDGTMQVKEVVTYDDRFDLNDVFCNFLNAMPDKNLTAEALLKHFNSDISYRATSLVPFSSERKKSAVNFDGLGTFVFGASEFVLKNIPEELRNQTDRFLKQGLRVLMLAHTDQALENEEIPTEVQPVCLVALSDHIRDDAIKTIDWFRECGVKIKIISGDNPVSVSQIAKTVGIDDADKFINLEGLSEEEVRKAANECTVFGRVSPEQKYFLVSEMRKAGNTVAMTGDGVNDILAFKEADCSIAMASGSEAARNVASLVLLDSNFASMPAVVLEGRRVVNNVQKSSSLFLMKTIFTIVFSIFIAILGVVYPITPSKLMLFEFCVIGIPSFLLVLQPNDNRIKGRFLTTVLSQAVPYAMVFIINAIVIYLFAPLFHLEMFVDDMVIYTMTYIGFIALFYLSLPLNRYRAYMLIGSITVISGGFLLLPQIRLGENPVLDVAQLPTSATIMCIVMILLAIPILYGLLKGADKIKKKIEERMEMRPRA